MKIASAGTFESNDCLITVKESDQLEIEIQSIVYAQFKDQIEKVIKDTLKEKGYEPPIHDFSMIYCSFEPTSSPLATIIYFSHTQILREKLSFLRFFTSQ